MKNRRFAAPVDPARIRKITGTFSWIDHRFLRWMEDLSLEENLLYLWLVAVGDRWGVSFYSDEKTASRTKLTVGDIVRARKGLIARRLIAYRNGVSQVLDLPGGDASSSASHERNPHGIERRSPAADPVSPGCREPFVPADGDKARHLSKRIIQDILRRLERAEDAA